MRTLHAKLRCALVIGLLSATTSSVAQDEPRAQLLSPSLGRPVFVAPGESFAVRAVMPHQQKSAEFYLVDPSAGLRRVRLTQGPAAAPKLVRGDTIVLTVPEGTPAITYDLEIRAGGATLRGRHCVAVTSATDQIRLVHLSNMNIGDLSAPRFAHRLVTEINMVAPTAIVMTGDYLDATHPDPRAGWRELVSFVERFDAPVIMACGDHDDVGLYSAYVAPSPVGVIQIGRHRAVVLYDHPGAPMDRDPDQIRWAESLVRSTPGDGLTIVIAHDDYPTLLARWRQQDTLAAMVRAGRVGLWIAGGHLDWDGLENKDVVAAGAPMQYVRTHQASSATLGGADGVAHYRVIEVVGDRIRQPTQEPDATSPTPSIATGHLRAAAVGANDGSQASVEFRAGNSLPYAMDRLALWLRVRKSGAARPWCRGGRIDQIIEHPAYWSCRVRFDLPDKSSLIGRVGCGPEPVQLEPVVRFHVPDVIDLRRRQAPSGLRYLQAIDASAMVEIANTAGQSITLAPQIRLDGEPIAYRPAGTDKSYVRRRLLTVAAGQSVRLQVDFSAVRVTPGRRTLQVYAGGGRDFVPVVHPVDIRVLP